MQWALPLRQLCLYCQLVVCVPAPIIFPVCTGDHHHFLPQCLFRPLHPCLPISTEFPPSTSSAAMSLSPFMQEYTSCPGLSHAKVDRTLVGNGEKKGLNQWSPTRIPNVALTMTVFCFPVPSDLHWPRYSKKLDRSHMAPLRHPNNTSMSQLTNLLVLQPSHPQHMFPSTTSPPNCHFCCLLDSC